jgi:hypothetical protein
MPAKGESMVNLRVQWVDVAAELRCTSATEAGNHFAAETQPLIARSSNDWRMYMLRSSNEFDPAKRGYHAVYRENEVNHCPGCGRTHWYVGRSLAECGFCATALPLAESFRRTPSAAIFHRGRAAVHARAV